VKIRVLINNGVEALWSACFNTQVPCTCISFEQRLTNYRCDYLKVKQIMCTFNTFVEIIQFGHWEKDMFVNSFFLVKIL